MKRFVLLIFCVSIVLSVAVPAIAAYSARPDVDPRVLQDIADGQVGQFLVVFRAQADTRAAAARTPVRAFRRQSVVDALRETADLPQSSLRAQLDTMRVKYHAYWIVNLLAVEGDQTVLDTILASSDVAAVESNRAFRVGLEQPPGQAPQSPAAVEWNLSKVGAPLMWSLGFTGTGQVYANADTGVQWDHPALKSHYRGWNTTTLTVTHDYNWWDAIHSQINPSGNSCGYNLQVPCDDYGHGTHTLGTGIGDDGAGNQIGMAPGAKWIACRNMDDGVGRPATYIECLQFLMAPTDLQGNNPTPALGAQVVGNSYTCPPSETCSVTSLQVAVDNMRVAGIFMAVSAGNSGSNCSSVSDPPPIYASSITVGATDTNDNLADFSSRGPVTVDGSNRRKPDLSAPGVNVRSSYPASSYAFLSGTSMASPHVAGAVSLLWSAVPSLTNNVDRTEFILEQSAVHFLSSQGCGGDLPSLWPNNAYGYGRIDVKAAYDLATHVSNPSMFIFPQVGRNF